MALSNLLDEQEQRAELRKLARRMTAHGSIIPALTRLIWERLAEQQPRLSFDERNLEALRLLELHVQEVGRCNVSSMCWVAEDPYVRS